MTTSHSSRHPRRRSGSAARQLAFRLLGGEGHAGLVVRVIDWFLIALIVLNVAAVVLESIEDLSIAHGPVFHAFDLASVAVFTLEYLARVWIAVELDNPAFKHPVWGRLRWMVTPMALIDLVAVLPFFLGMVVEMDLRAIRVLRVMRVFKLGRYSMAMTVMAAVARQEARAIGAVLFVMVVVLVFTSSLMYLFEHRAQPHVFRDIPTAMWWSIVTLTTLGYGDMVPLTPLGRMLGGITAVLGVGMIALPAGVLASGFSEQMRIRREEYREAVAKALEDGRITKAERHLLDDVRDQLGLSEEEAAQILRDSARRPALCPHCGLPSQV